MSTMSMHAALFGDFTAAELEILQERARRLAQTGLDAARRHSVELRDEAHSALAESGLTDAARLALLADRIVDREH